MSRGDENCGQREMPQQDDAGPLPDFAAHLRIGFGNHLLQPPRFKESIITKVTGGRCHPETYYLEHVGGAKGEGSQHEFYAVPVEALRQDYLSIMIGVGRCLMVTNVAGAVARVIKPSEEGKYPEKKCVPELRGKRRLVPKLVRRDAPKKTGMSAMKK